MPKKVYEREEWELVVEPIEGQGTVFRGEMQIAKVRYDIRYERQVKFVPHKGKTIRVDIDLTRIVGKIKLLHGDVETDGHVVKMDDVLTLHLKEGCKLNFSYIPIANREYEMVVRGEFY